MAPRLFCVGLMNPDVLPQDGKHRFRDLTLLLEFWPSKSQVIVHGLAGSCNPNRGCVLYQDSQRRIVREVKNAGIEEFANLYPWPLVNKAIRRSP